ETRPNRTSRFSVEGGGAAGAGGGAALATGAGAGAEGTAAGRAAVATAAAAGGGLSGGWRPISRWPIPLPLPFAIGFRVGSIPDLAFFEPQVPGHGLAESRSSKPCRRIDAIDPDGRSTRVGSRLHTSSE